MADSRRLDQPRDPHRITLPRWDPEAFGNISEAIARFMGTARFLVYMTVVILLWIGWNTLAPRQLRFDPYTFTFLTLMLSLQASYAAPLILLAQNRQADRDRMALEEDRRRAAMQKADTEYLAREIAALRIAVGEMATRDFIRSELARLAEEVDEAADRRSKADRKERKEARRATRPAPAAAPLDKPAAPIGGGSAGPKPTGAGSAGPKPTGAGSAGAIPDRQLDDRDQAEALAADEDAYESDAPLDHPVSERAGRRRSG